MTSDTILDLLIIVFLLLANAFFVAAEFALVRVRRTRTKAYSAATKKPLARTSRARTSSVISVLITRTL